MAPPALSVLDAVPPEVLSEIFLYLCNSFGVGFLKPCLHVCKHWHAIALPLFHRDVRLVDKTIGPFAQNIDSSIAVHVKSLSIHIGWVLYTQRMHWRHLDMLASGISLMTNLLTLSLVIIPHHRSGIDCYIHHKYIAALLDNVPSSCTQLELDTNGCDHSQPAYIRWIHVCDAIRRLVPQLRHLRLRLRTLCAAMFPNEPAPHLETLVINCIPGSIYRSCSVTCGKRKQSPYNSSPKDGTIVSRLALASTARAMYNDGKLPKVVHLCIVDVQKSAHTIEMTYPTLHQRDIIRNETWCMPFKDISIYSKPDSYLLRTADGGEVLSSPQGVQDLVEGRQWSETINGVRLPTATLRAEAFELGRRVVRELPLLSPADWKARHPNDSCMLWNNERLTGMRLLRPVRLDGVFDTQVLREETPKGWVRHVTDLVAE